MKIKDNIYMIESGKGAHIYLIKGKESFIIDCGMPGNVDKILSEIKELGVESKEVTDILLTHSDIDHIGNAKALKDSTGAKVWCSKEEYPYVEGTKKRKRLKILIGKIFKAEKPEIVNFYNENKDIKGMKTIFTPGHTEGHTIFLYEKVLFIGDLFQVKNGKISLMSKLMNWNEDEVRKSISKIKNIDFQWICPAHGTPIKNGDDVKKFLSQF